MRCPSLKMRKRCTSGQNHLVFCTGCKPRRLLYYAITEIRGQKITRH